MILKLSNLNLVMMILAVSACVAWPGYYGDGPGPAPNYGYYGYGPAYPWDTGVSVDIANGYGHGGYYGRGGYGGGYYGRGGYGGGGRGGGRR